MIFTILLLPVLCLYIYAWYWDYGNRQAMNFWETWSACSFNVRGKSYYKRDKLDAFYKETL